MRYLAPYILKDLQKKMVFLGGPRQCGKTTLAKNLEKKFDAPLYLNWDNDFDRKTILKHGWMKKQGLIIFDELHKFSKWKSWIKGIYDTKEIEQKILVTGSARLDVYKKGGDSLMGRYHYWRLHPFSLSELPKGISPEEGFERLMRVGGFPEPFLDNNISEARRWRRERLDKVVRDDVRDLENLKNIQGLDLLIDLLRSRVGSPVVVRNLAEDLQISPLTVKHWIEVLEKMYVIFQVRPYSKHLPRALQKPPKIYFFDNGDVDGDEGMKFENLVATHLLKTLHFLEDREGFRYELCYVRDKEKREVDFLILKDKKPQELIEAKWSEDRPTTALKYFAGKINPAHVTQIVGKKIRSSDRDNIRIISAVQDLQILERPSLL